MAAAKSLTTAVDVAGMQRPSGTLDVAIALAPYEGPWNERLAAHLLRRAGFGGTQDEIARYARMGVGDAVESLIHFPSTASLPQPPQLTDPSVLRRAALDQGVVRPAMATDVQRRAVGMEVRRDERTSILELQLWWLNRMLSTPAPLQEKMALYYHGHFTTAAIQKGVFPSLVYNQNDLYRRSALGNLAQLTMEVSQDPAMLLYLDNAGSSAAHPNENYARELMELFTLGVDHFTENDVREAARAWTGYNVNRRTGEAFFNPRAHDGGSKTFLGQTGNFAGKDVVDIIFSQRQCAAFFAESLLNGFLYNNPEPALIDAVAAMLWKNTYNVAPVMSALLRSNIFYGARAYRALVKSPAEFLVGTYKALGVPTIESTALRAMSTMGQVLFYPPNVAGWPGGENWLTSQMMIARQNFVAQLANSPTVAQSAWMTSAPDDPQAATRTLLASILQGDASPTSVAQIVAYLDGSGTSALAALSMENREERLRGAAYLTMAMPAYQLN
jgi:uncharacterized protein (DUF1800 family)